ncbi:hypothetical protein [Micromonospora sp. RTGN7]|uniref:hypothetical protein n=1 Tax=Micromonospora sp. RTGN7 TaxID=3016526 RepID=UPI0029FF1199|nr:hypothetical protein [Micromonospora sp. RTGN7]
MPRPTITQRVRARIPGVPRTGREALSSLQVLAVLRNQGWHRTVNGGTPADAAGRPVPWLTYPAVDLLDRILTPETRVFEYGSGASTRWFGAGRAAEVVAVEHDPDWFARLPQPNNGRIIHVPGDGARWDTDPNAPYVRAAAAGAPWDMIVVDGMARTTCAAAAPDHLHPHGLVVLDDTDHPGLVDAQEELTRRGMGRIDFWGFKPGIGLHGCTSVFAWDFNHWLVAGSRARRA